MPYFSIEKRVCFLFYFSLDSFVTIFLTLISFTLRWTGIFSSNKFVTEFLHSTELSCYVSIRGLISKFYRGKSLHSSIFLCEKLNISLVVIIFTVSSLVPLEGVFFSFYYICLLTNDEFQIFRYSPSL